MDEFRKELERKFFRPKSNDDIEIRIIDSCEYIIYSKYNTGGYSSGICHKSNCRNPIHQKK
jgi:hypothetical protein